MVEYVIELTKELHKLAIYMIKESLEQMDELLQNSGKRKQKCVVESHTSKKLTTSLGDVTFHKTLFTNKEAVQTSYRHGGKEVSLTCEVSKQTVKNKIYKLKFPKKVENPEKKKAVDFICIEADEDHASLQFKEKKGDLIKNENHRKNNCLIMKLVYVLEGIEKEAPKSNQHELVNPYYFCRVNQGGGDDVF